MEPDLNIDIDPELLAEFVDEAQDGLGELDSLFVELEENPSDKNIIESIFRPVHTIKGNSAFFGLMKVKKLAHELETLLSLAKEEKLVPNKDIISLLLRGTDEIKAMLNRARGGGREVEDDHIFENLIQKVIKVKTSGMDHQTVIHDVLKRLSGFSEQVNSFDSELAQQFHGIIAGLTPLVESREEPPPKPETMENEAPASEADKAGGSQTGSSKGRPQERKTMRIAEENIDTFLNYVGELVVVGEMYGHLFKRVSESAANNAITAEFRRVNETFEDLSNHLQKSIMEIRKVPVKNLLQKVPRMIRDIAASSGKDIKVELFGEDIEIDKSIVETLDAPLTHMARNAADHGIETIEDRKKADKPIQGVVKVGVEESDESITLKIIDDGKGLNYEALTKKAIQSGIIESGQELSREQVTDLIFASGVSTAEKVTDVSGRGVGMDVVKRAIESANGKIQIESSPGQGSTFSIRMPKSVSTQIIDGFLVQLEKNCYVIPMEKIREAFHPEQGTTNTVTNQGKCVCKHGKLLPVIELAKLFGLYNRPEDFAGIMVAVQHHSRQFALQVDQVLGTQKVVLKELKGLELQSQLFEGAAIMGDGSVAMVLDIDNIVKNMP